jgi:hypothetical protein
MRRYSSSGWNGLVIVGAGLQAFDALGPGIACGEDQHRNRQAGRAPLRQHIKPRYAGQAEVEDDQVIGLAAALIHRVTAIGQPIHCVALALQTGEQLVGQRYMVFHQKQTHRSIFLVFD